MPLGFVLQILLALVRLGQALVVNLPCRLPKLFRREAHRQDDKRYRPCQPSQFGGVLASPDHQEIDEQDDHRGGKAKMFRYRPCQAGSFYWRHGSWQQNANSVSGHWVRSQYGYRNRRGVGRFVIGGVLVVHPGSGVEVIHVTANQ